MVGGGDDDGVARRAVGVAGTGVTNQPVGKSARSNVETQSPIRRKRQPGPAVANQFDADEKSPPADIADLVESRQGAANGLLKRRTDGTNSIEQAIALDDVLHGQSRRAGGGVAGEGVSGHERTVFGMNGCGDPRRDQRRSQWDVAAAQPFGDAHDVRDPSIILQGSPSAAASRTA